MEIGTAPLCADVRDHGEYWRESGTDTEPGLEKWLLLNAQYAKIWPNITVKKAPPPDSKEWEGKPDKFQYFSPNPGAGD
jgi:hypothetical protein